MRVAFVGGRGFSSNYGGVENAIREISQRVATQGYEVDVYGQGSDRGFSKRQVAEGLFEVSAPRAFSRFSGNALLAGINCLYALTVRRPRVILLFASGPSLLTPLARLLGIRVIAALRAIDSQRDKWGGLSAAILRMGEFSAVHLSTRCTVNSQEMYRYFRGDERQLRYIPNGATLPRLGADRLLAELGLKPGAYLLFAARLDPMKRLHLLLEAYRRIAESDRLPLVVAGGNCRSPAYQAQIDALATTGVRFVGHADHSLLDPLMRNCGLFVLPSVLEGMSNSLLAAMGAGRAVLCADVDSNRDVILGDTESLFAADDVDELTAHLTAFCRDPALRERCGERMQRIAVEHYNWDVTARQYGDLIREVAGDSRG